MTTLTHNHLLPEAEHRAIARHDRQHGRHHHRMVRFPALQHGDRPPLVKCRSFPVRSWLALEDLVIYPWRFIARPIGAAILQSWRPHRPRGRS
jgi:hypothetical protein